MTNEHAHEQTQAATNPAGDSFAKDDSFAMIANACRAIAYEVEADLIVRGSSLMRIAERIEALAASHRERSERDVPNGANCAQGEAVARWTEIARDGQLSDWNLEMASLRKYFAGLASQPADKPAGQADNSQATPARGTDAWRPIETAPKDGETRLLLCDEGGEPYFGYRPIDCPDDAACNEYGIACYPGYWSPSPPMPGHALAPEPATAGDDLKPFRSYIVAARDRAIDDERCHKPPCSVEDREALEQAQAEIEEADRLLALIDGQAQRTHEATPAAAVPDKSQPAVVFGEMVLVPREPDDAMLDAGLSALSNSGVDSPIEQDAELCYRAMLAASPDLLEALREMVDLRDAGLRSEVHPTRHELDIVRDARAAISKATGVSP